ncbi:MAG: aspartate aminotransferase family protein [Actinobacteria bacterium]|nr:aspartate aminotransferase family protein [Actinomycetota bacterium]
MTRTATSRSRNAGELETARARHLWGHFQVMASGSPGNAVPIMVRGDGCHVWDAEGNRYFDGISSLFCTNIGHGRPEVVQAGADQAREIAYFTNWTAAHPQSITLAERIASRAPGDLNRVFFTSGGSESVESAIKLARHYHKLTGHPRKTKFIAREIAYHGSSLGALSATGIPGLREPYEPLAGGGLHVPNTDVYRFTGADPLELAEAIGHRIEFEGPETVAAVILEPVQNAGGCLTPPPGYFARVREICDEHDVLLISDEVICSWGRLGAYFGCERLSYQPDILTTAKGLTSGYAPMGAMIFSDQIAEAFITSGAAFLHGYTFGGHPVCAAIAHANLDIIEAEGLVEHVVAHEGAFRDMLESLRDVPIVGDVRGMGYFHAIELVKDQATKESFNTAECDWLLRDFLSPELLRRGLICRADDRGEPVVQLSPPLIATPEHFDEIHAILRPVLEEAAARLSVTNSPPKPAATEDER